jgi:hypothetical protein
MKLEKRHLDAIASHFTNVSKSLRELAASHERLHKAADIVGECHKLHGLAHAAEVRAGRIKPGSDIDKAHTLHKAAHESFRLERLKHKATHQEHVTKTMDALQGILKVLSGPAAAGDTSSPGSTTSLPSRLATSSPDAQKVAGTRIFRNAASPFGLLNKAEVVQKAETPARRVSPHERNPHMTG